MKLRSFGIIAVIILLSSLNLGMSRHGEYDEEARAAQKAAKSGMQMSNPATGIASGVKEAAYDSTAGLLSETAEGAKNEDPISGTLEGARTGTGKVLDSAVKGAVKVATLGQGNLEHYEVQEPEKNSGDTTKITIKIPGT